MEDALGCHDLRQPYFCKCVVLIVEHDSEFTQGIILNRPSNLNFNDQEIIYLDDDGTEIFPSQQDTEQDEHVDEKSWRMFFGGDIANVYEDNPLIVCLHNNTSELAQSVSETVLPGIYLTSHLGARSLIYSGEAAEEDFYTFAGFCGWEPGQLEREVKRKSWYMVSADSNTIWNELKALRGPKNEPRKVGMDMWRGIVKAIREDELPQDNNTFADLMLKEWATQMLMVGKDESDTADVEDSDIYRALKVAEQTSLLPGTLVRGSSADLSPFLLQDQFLHKSIVLILNDSEFSSVGLVLNLPTTESYSITMSNGNVVDFPIRYGGPGGENEEEDPLIWLHNNESLKSMKIGKSLNNNEDADSVFTCALNDVISCLESGAAAPGDFLLVQGFCVWEKEADSAGGIKGQVLNGNFEVQTGGEVNKQVWSRLSTQERLSEETLSKNIQLSVDAWSAGFSPVNDRSIRTVFESEVKVSTLSDEALMNWMKIFLLGNAEYYR